jgi:hypothetical protein
MENRRKSLKAKACLIVRYSGQGLELVKNTLTKWLKMEKTYKDFEDFLIDFHADQYVGLDDEMPDDFNKFLEEMDIEDWLKLGTIYGQQKGIEESREFIQRMEGMYKTL